MSLGPRDRGTESHEFLMRQGLLDQREQHVFLMADVPTQACAQLVQIDEGGSIRVGQCLCPLPQVDVLYEDAHDRVMVRRHVAGEPGEHQLLLDGEVLAAFVLPEGEKRRARGCRVGRRRAAQFQGGDQSVVMVSRELRELLAALHAWGCTAASPLRGSLDESAIDGSYGVTVNFSFCPAM